MKKIILFIAIGFLTFACGQKTSRKADVSNIDVEIKISRFDKDFWALKNSKNLGADLDKLFKKYPKFAPIYFGGVVYFGQNRDTILSILPKFFADSVASHFCLNAVFSRKR